MHLHINEIKKIKLNFIICMERTGSSMLTAMLNKNEQVLSTSEEPFLLYLYKKYNNKYNYNKHEIDILVEEFWLTSEKNLSLFYETKENLKQCLYSYLPEINFNDLCKILYLNFIPLKDKNKIDVIIDKQIKFIHYIPLIIKIFPESKILILTRNHKDVITSWKKRKLGQTQNAAYLAKVYNLNYINITNLKNIVSENLQILKYEDLVSNPANELKKVCDFFGIYYFENMIEHHTQFNAYIDKMADKIEQDFLDHLKTFQSNTMKPVSTDLINEWKKVLNNKEVEVSDKINYDLDLFFHYNNQKSKYFYTFFDRLNIARAWFEKKIYHSIYIQSPLWAKLIIKKNK